VRKKKLFVVALLTLLIFGVLTGFVGLGVKHQLDVLEKLNTAYLQGDYKEINQLLENQSLDVKVSRFFRADQLVFREDLMLYFAKNALGDEEASTLALKKAKKGNPKIVSRALTHEANFFFNNKAFGKATVFYADAARTWELDRLGKKRFEVLKYYVGGPDDSEKKKGRPLLREKQSYLEDLYDHEGSKDKHKPESRR